MNAQPFYEDATHGTTIYHADCLDVLPLLDAVDHVITDPPYSLESHSMHDAGKKWATRQDGLERAGLKFTGVDGPLLNQMLTTVEIKRWAVFTMDERLSAWLRMNTPEGWKYVRTGVWIKPGSMPQFTGDRPAMGYEPVVIMHRTGGRMRWNGGGRCAVWTFNPLHGEHPTEKPESLYETFIDLFTDPGDLILDPFMGSGTTLVAAKKLGRRAIGIELEEKWCAVAKKRLQATAREPSMFETLPPEPFSQEAML